MAKKYRPVFEQGSLTQKHLTKEEALAVYQERGGDEAFFTFFYLRYDDAYDSYKWCELASDRSLRDAFNMTRWYAFYKKIGHNEDWCLIAMMYNYPNLDCDNLDIDPEDYTDKELSFENDMECLQQCINKFPDEHELEIHREFVKKYFNEGVPF